MGTIYRETVCSKNKISNLAMLILTIILFIDIIILIGDFEYLNNGYEAAGFIIMFLTVAIGFIIWHRNRINYRYAIIDNELIIERIKGKKKSVQANFNIKNIIAIESIKDFKGDVKPSKVYDFSISSDRDKVYKCIFKRDDIFVAFYFEPSSELIRKINFVRNGANIA